MPPKIALITCLNLPETDNDEQITLQACQNAGLQTTLAAWDDPQVDWSNFDLAILRSTWDYPEKPTQFSNFIKEVEKRTNLYNPANLVLNNIDKTYLLELAQFDIPIVPTHQLRCENINKSLPSVFPDSDKIVIKPNIGAGSWGIKVFSKNQTQDQIDHCKFLINEGAQPLIQPYMKSVESGGERSIILIDGQPTHKIVKTPRFHGDDEAVSQAQPVTQDEAAFAQKVLKILPSETLYARVDIIMSDQNEMLLSELELIEPSLFFLQNPASLDLFVKAIQKRL